jgi:hypothetical protein
VEAHRAYLGLKNRFEKERMDLDMERSKSEATG